MKELGPTAGLHGGNGRNGANHAAPNRNGASGAPGAEDNAEDNGPLLRLRRNSNGWAAEPAAIRLRRRRRVSGPFTAVPELRRDRLS